MEKIYKNYNAALNAALRFFKKQNAVALIAGENENVATLLDDEAKIAGDYGFIVVVLFGNPDFTAPDAGPCEFFHYELTFPLWGLTK